MSGALGLAVGALLLATAQPPTTTEPDPKDPSAPLPGGTPTAPVDPPADEEPDPPRDPIEVPLPTWPQR